MQMVEDRKVLLVDSDPERLEKYEKALQKYGFSVQTAYDGRSAMNQLGGDGIGIVAATSNFQHLKELFLTSRERGYPFLLPGEQLEHSSDMENMAASLGGVGILRTNFSEEDLLSAIKMHYRSKHAPRSQQAPPSRASASQ